MPSAHSYTHSQADKQLPVKKKRPLHDQRRAWPAQAAGAKQPSLAA